MTLRVGMVLHGYCEGWFDDDYGDKRVEAIGADWVVVRNERGIPLFDHLSVDPDYLVKFTKEDP